MAERLKREHNLFALKVILDIVGAEPRVRIGLEASRDHVLQREAEWSYTPEELGLPERMSRGQVIPLRLPAAMLGELRAVLADEEISALWLHLVKPYAHLGIAPWERVLTHELGRPVLRLPDFLVPPAKESPHTLDIALCVSEPLAKSPFKAPSFIDQFVRRVAAEVPRSQVTVHLFTDLTHYHTLTRSGPRLAKGRVRVPSKNGEVWLRVHDPERAASYADLEVTTILHDEPGRVDNPWLLWMRDVMCNQSLSMVHFGTHGYYALDRGAIALASSPMRNDDANWARFVGAAELETFLTQVGAWAVGFSSPPSNFSDAGLRHLADDLAQRKPFATLYHDFAHDAACRDLAAAYRFLFDPRPARPPTMPSVSLYCQPWRMTGNLAGLGISPEAEERVLGSQPSRKAETLLPATVDAEKTVTEIFSNAKAVPTWLAAAQRFVEGHAWLLRQWNATPTSPDQQVEFDVTRRALGEIQELIARHAPAAHTTQAPTQQTRARRVESTGSKLRNLLKSELSDLLYAEQLILKMLGTLTREVKNPQALNRVQEHIGETEEQIQRLRRAFEIIGEKATATTSEAAVGLKSEHDSFKKEKRPSKVLLEAFNLGNGLRVEHYEIAGYRSAIAVATAMGERELAGLLGESLREEEAMASFIERNSVKMLRALGTGMDPASGTTEAPFTPEDLGSSKLRSGTSRSSASKSKRDKVAEAGLSGLDTSSRSRSSQGSESATQSGANERASGPRSGRGESKSQARGA